MSFPVALNYGVFRRAQFNTSATTVMFYDVGASSAKATIVCKFVIAMIPVWYVCTKRCVDVCL